MPSFRGALRNLTMSPLSSTTKKGSITCVQAVYVPADDLTDPAPATTFAHLDATTTLSRGIAELGIYPAVDPLDSKSRMLDPRIVGQEHYDTATQVQKLLQDYKGLQDIIAILGMDELSEADKLTVRDFLVYIIAAVRTCRGRSGLSLSPPTWSLTSLLQVERARKVQRFMSQPFAVAEAFVRVLMRFLRAHPTFADLRSARRPAWRAASSRSRSRSSRSSASSPASSTTSRRTPSTWLATSQMR